MLHTILERQSQAAPAIQRASIYPSQTETVAQTASIADPS